MKFLIKLIKSVLHISKTSLLENFYFKLQPLQKVSKRMSGGYDNETVTPLYTQPDHTIKGMLKNKTKNRKTKQKVVCIACC